MGKKLKNCNKKLPENIEKFTNQQGKKSLLSGLCVSFGGSKNVNFDRRVEQSDNIVSKCRKEGVH